MPNTSTKADTTRKGVCPHCGQPLADGPLAELCPACLLEQAARPATGPDPGSRFEPPTVNELATLLPQLEILGWIGRGGMGAVYKARQPGLDRPVALKVLSAPAEGAREGFRARFEREAHALARLSHPNIVAVYDVGTAGDYPYLLMEYVDGVNLRQLERSGHVSPHEALQIIPQICDALQYAHDEGIVHRDIKPENVLVDRKGNVKIADFGVAKLVGGDRAGAPLTDGGQILGTPLYMAPEQIEHPLHVDHRADIYSLGVVFYEMLTGELPLGRFAPPSRKVEVNVQLDEVVLRTLEKEPELRYQQAEEVKTAVRDAGAQRPSASPVAETRSAAAPAREGMAHGGSGMPPLVAWCLPPALFLWFVLGGHAALGVDLDADVQAWSGFFGFPVATALGVLLAWVVTRRVSDGGSASGSRVCWVAAAALAVLLLATPLAGMSAVFARLAAAEFGQAGGGWNPSSGELVVVLGAGTGVLLLAGSTVVLGLIARRRQRRVPAPRWQRPWAGGAIWFWPVMLVVTLALVAIFAEQRGE